ALYPRINRFICNGRIYARNCIQISFLVKKVLSQDAADATIKIATIIILVLVLYVKQFFSDLQVFFRPVCLSPRIRRKLSSTETFSSRYGTIKARHPSITDSCSVFVRQ
ncbi:MAG: hypothetical protein IIU26_02160, partial [Clostridium sp.]|nr:hypothetical protein [Clostridium sp.]